MSVASSERSFSKLKIVKKYLRSTMDEERLDALMIVTCSSEVLDNLETDECLVIAENKENYVVNDNINHILILLVCHMLFLKTLLYIFYFSYFFYLTLPHLYKASIF